ncbi:hypothetical protein PR202_ga07864 [Eleusine coracana subsp. coracana]|uniref:Endonuclease/exonuclease/phosphatase domain-containing protein n=1 Tax=Eleusine coracana subsp. coracana TaxID=191504 RepID=A0AAV5C183_ELECO|nr:hypothetical protein PR202_ga07864 [Eleusine coracana subsp. coracana]
MRLLSWNCQGSGRSLSSPTTSQLARLIVSTKSQVIFISKTRLSRINKTQLINRFYVIDSYVVPSNGQSGGLWLMWNDDISITVIQSSHHLILAKAVYNPSNQHFNLICMYGDPHHLKTNAIWEEVTSFVLDNPHTATFCMGDLNNIMNVNEKCGPTLANAACIRNFCCLVKDCGLFDLGFNGLVYTWTNKCHSTKPTFQRLDKCLANADWCSASQQQLFFTFQ